MNHPKNLGPAFSKQQINAVLSQLEDEEPYLEQLRRSQNNVTWPKPQPRPAEKPESALRLTVYGLLIAITIAGCLSAVAWVQSF